MSSTEPGHSSDSHTRLDGQPDQRFKEHGGGQHGNQGGRETGLEEIGDGTSSLRTTGGGEDGTYKPSEHSGQTKDGGQDKRMSSEHGFGSSDGPDPSKEGQKGGSASYANGGLTQ